MQRLKEYMAHAATCRALAAKAKNPHRKAELLELADKWTFLAEEREKLLHTQKWLRDSAEILVSESVPTTTPCTGPGTDLTKPTV